MMRRLPVTPALSSRAGISAATSMPVNPAPTTTTVERASDGSRRPSPVEMRIKLERGFISVDVKSVLGETRNRGANEFAAEREHQAIISQHLPTVAARDGDLLLREIDRPDFGKHDA